MADIQVQENIPLFQNPFSTTESGSSSVVQGEFQGQTVVVRDTAASLADAAEELTFSASETVEKELSERKIEKKEKKQGILQIEAIIKKMGDIDKKQMEGLLRTLKALVQSNSKQILDLTRQAFKDPSHQHLALSWIKEQVSGQSDLQAHIATALLDLETNQGAEIRAGYNIAGVEMEGIACTPENRRMLYRDMVLDFDNYSATFLSLSNKYESKELGQALTFLLSALGADMAATEPSCEKAQLKEVMDALYMIKTLSTFYSSTSNLIESLTKTYGKNIPHSQEIMEPVLRYNEVSLLLDTQVTKDMPFLISDNVSRDVELIQGIRELIRAMPHKVFLNNESRQQVLDTFQNILDTAIDREEMELA